MTHSDDLDYSRLADRLNSASYMPSVADSRHPAMMAALQKLFAATAQAGVVTMTFETRVLFGPLR